MILLLEIGNSTIKLVRAEGELLSGIERYDDIDSFERRCASFDAPIVCAPVNAAPSRRVLDRLRGRDLRVLGRSDFDAFIAGSYDTPETLGLDRILNLLGLGPDGIAISCGTAITVDAVVGGRPIWGAILPGFRTAAEGLHERVPALPLVEPQTPTHLPARTSEQSVANGVLLGTALAAQGIAERLADGMRVVITGGDAELLAKLWEGKKPEVDEVLLFRGMMKTIEG
jgi:pantothenate kinase type III